MKVKFKKFKMEKGRFWFDFILTHLRIEDDNWKFIKFSKITPELLECLSEKTIELNEEETEALKQLNNI